MVGHMGADNTQGSHIWKVAQGLTCVTCHTGPDRVGHTGADMMGHTGANNIRESHRD